MKKNRLASLNDKELRNYLNRNGILPKWHNKTIDQFTNDPTSLSKVKKYIDDAPKMLHNNVGLFLWGANGTGKTHLMTTSFVSLMKKGYTAKIISLSTLIAKFTAGWYDMSEKRELQQTLQRVQFLGIEEVGKEFRSQNSDLGTVVFDNILRYRVQMGKPTWFTSNIDPNKLTATYTEDITSMLKECCFPIQVKGKDKRQDSFDKIKDYFENDAELEL